MLSGLVVYRLRMSEIYYPHSGGGYCVPDSTGNGRREATMLMTNKDSELTQDR